MAVKLLGLEWEDRAVAAAPSGPVMEYSNASVGTFYATHAAASELVDSEQHIVLSAVYQISVLDKKLVVCLETEKSIFTNSELRPATLEDIYAMYPLTFSEKQEGILKTLLTLNSNVGELITVDFQPFKFFSKNIAEMRYLIDLMKSKSLLKLDVPWTVMGAPGSDTRLMIMESGWLLLEDKVLQARSKNVFVAMWFDETMENAFLAIKKAIEKHGFEAVRIDRKPHNNEISGEILYEIRRCRFLIAEVTKQRQGVYFEAGYAKGKDIPIIWCCKSSDLKKVHFDTRQYNHVVWKDENELFEKLDSRIKGTILR